MAATETAVVNIALRRIGSAKIADLDTGTTREALAAQDIFDDARDDVLRSHPWNFATTRSQLTAHGTDPTFGWDYGYALPTDFLRIVSVHPIDDDDADIDYRLETYSVGGTQKWALLCQSNQVYLRYVAQITTTTLWTAGFTDAFAWRLARDLCLALPKSQSLYQNCDREYRRSLAYAKSVDGIEDYAEKFPDPSWVTERFS